MMEQQLINHNHSVADSAGGAKKKNQARDFFSYPPGASSRRAPQVLVLAPTRELTMQIAQEAAKYQHCFDDGRRLEEGVPRRKGTGKQQSQQQHRGGKWGQRGRGPGRDEFESVDTATSGGIATACVYGGASRMAQIGQLRRGADADAD